MDPTEYINNLERENGDLRAEISRLTHENDQLKFDIQLAEEDVKSNQRSGSDLYIKVEDKTIYLKDLKHMEPMGSKYEIDNIKEKKSVSLAICLNCMTVGYNNASNLWKKTGKVSKNNKSILCCRNCGCETNYVITSGQWVKEQKWVQRIVKRKRWFTGKIYDDLQTDLLKIERWKFAHERC